MRDAWQGILTGLVMAMVLLLPALAYASGCRPVTFRTYHAPTTYVAPLHHNYVEIIKAVPVAVAPDYFWSVRDYYRDSLLADAIAYRLLAAQQGGTPPLKQPVSPEAGTPPLRSVPMPRAEEPAQPVGNFPQLAYTACASCHNKTKAQGGFAWFDGQKMLPIEAQQTGDVVTAVLEGRMPKGQRWSDAQKVQFLSGFVGGGK